MIKEWATVVSWQNGEALVSCDVKASCSSCASRSGCGTRVLNKLGPQTTHTIVVASDVPLEPGQKVELGIAEGSLLGSAMLVYLSPLVGLPVAIPASWLNAKPGNPLFLMLLSHPVRFALKRPPPKRHHDILAGWRFRLIRLTNGQQVQ